MRPAAAGGGAGRKGLRRRPSGLPACARRWAPGSLRPRAGCGVGVLGARRRRGDPLGKRTRGVRAPVVAVNGPRTAGARRARGLRGVPLPRSGARGPPSAQRLGRRRRCGRLCAVPRGRRGPAPPCASSESPARRPAVGMCVRRRCPSGQSAPTPPARGRPSCGCGQAQGSGAGFALQAGSAPVLEMLDALRPLPRGFWDVLLPQGRLGGGTQEALAPLFGDFWPFYCISCDSLFVCC